MSAVHFDVVVPTLGRPSLDALLQALARDKGPRPDALIVVDDRPQPRAALELPELPTPFAERLCVLRSGGRGPAAARNVGWRAGHAPWVAFLDDDTLPCPGWLEQLQVDLAPLQAAIAGSQGLIAVPRPPGRAPTDAERNVIALEGAPWITADLAYRRSVLRELGGFDERFRRAFREDSDFALRALRGGYELTRGERRTLHPIGAKPGWSSVAAQAGNADDVLMRALHGADWRRRSGAPAGRLPRHFAVTAAAAAAGTALLAGTPGIAGAAALAWLAGTLGFAAERIWPGPRSGEEIARMLWTSALIPPLAAAYHALGRWRLARVRRAGPLQWPPAAAAPRPRPLRLVLLDRDGTLIEDEPGLADPARVRPLPGARSALDRLRAAGVQLAVVSNQPGLARGRPTAAQLERVHAELERQLGPFAGFFVCPHAEREGCACRKPAPGLLVRALHTLGAAPHECALIGDIGSDVEAAAALGIHALLVPTAVTRAQEIASAPGVAVDLARAVEQLLDGSR
jgi:histidinol-phosphate phosphatase family protein